MCNPFLNIWLIFLLGACIFVVYFLFYIKYIGNLQEIYIKTFYLGLSFLSLFIYFFIHDAVLWQHFSNLINEVLIIKDIQDLVTIGLDLSIFYAIYFISPLVGLYILFYYINYKQLTELSSYFFSFCLIFYYFFLLKFLLDNDLFLSNWTFLIKHKDFGYDFQPDLIYLILTYLGDFYDLIIFFVLLIFYLLNFKLFQKIAETKIQIGARLFINVGLSCLICYFFGGEFFWSDVILICCSFIYLELNYLVWLFFTKLKYKKVKYVLKEN